MLQGHPTAPLKMSSEVSNTPRSSVKGGKIQRAPLGLIANSNKSKVTNPTNKVANRNAHRAPSLAISPFTSLSFCTFTLRIVILRHVRKSSQLYSLYLTMSSKGVSQPICDVTKNMPSYSFSYLTHGDYATMNLPFPPYYT